MRAHEHTGTDDTDQTAAVRAAVDAGADDVRRAARSSGCASRRSPATRRTTATYAGPPSWLAAGLAGHRLPDRRGLGDRRACPRSSPSGPATTRTRRPSLVYGHHDVQPVTPLELLGAPARSSRPSTATGCTRRGAADDKGQVFFHTLGVRAHLAATGRTAPGGEPQAARRGRGGVRLTALRRPARASSRTGSPATSWSSPTPACGRARPRPCAPACAAWPTARSTCAGPTGDVHSGSFGGAIRNPLTELCRLLGAAARRRRARHRSPASTTASSSSPTTSGRCSRSCPSTRRPGWRNARSDDGVRREGLHHPGAGLGPADRRGQRHLGRLHRRRATRRSSRPRRTRSCPSGWSPARSRSTCRRSSRPGSATACPPGIDWSDHVVRRRRAARA